MKQRILRLVCIAVSIICGNTIYAQKCVVYSIIGNVSTVNGDRQSSIQLRDTLNMNTTIKISGNSILELFDETNRKKYVINTPGCNTVANMLKDKRNDTIELTENYFNYILRNIRNNNGTIIRTCSDIASVTREVLADSIAYASENE
ncbi:hypothetical protein [Xylanibacter muris]|uniref:Uncharacterized protein n=1 Tax=Xylanibacter muris TaxID=2736290 RepID=A0ABX2AJ50_9BACT|nr:hypothetical protein [Xylanibacter muris]NPD91143.1 hypothetical protein [Xylanibacter muris]